MGIRSAILIRLQDEVNFSADSELRGVYLSFNSTNFEAT